MNKPFDLNWIKLQLKKSKSSRKSKHRINSYFSAFWQQRLKEDTDHLREQIAQLQREYDEQATSFSDRLETAATQNSEYLQVGKEFLLFKFQVHSILFSDGIFFKQNQRKKSMN